MSSATKGKRRVRFEIEADPESDVMVAGTFNGWEPVALPLKRGGGVFSRAVFLEKGTYEYKFRIDGEWRLDPQCPEVAPNPFGTGNSVIRIS